MKIGSKFKVSNGTLTVRSVSKEGKQNMVTLWHDAENTEYSKEVQIPEDMLKRMVIRAV